MKKTYIAPEAVEYKVSTQSVMQTSLIIDKETEVDGDGALVKEEKGNFLWN